MIPILDAVLPLIGKIFDRVLPDPVAAADAKLKLMALVQNGELEALHADTQLALGQIDVNKTEAASSSIFVSGWRPFIGWTCGGALAYKFILQPLLVFAFTAFGHPITLPVLDFAEMSTVLMGMLGLGGMRTYEKVKGAA
jgi:hypothetical protein